MAVEFGGRRGGLGLVDEHSRGQPREAAVIQMGGAPVVFVPAVGSSACRTGCLGEVVEQTSLRRGRGAHHFFQVRPRISGDLPLRKPVTGSRHQYGNIDDEAAQLLEGGPEPRQYLLTWPDVWRQ